MSNVSYSWTLDISYRIVGKNSKGSTKVRTRLAYVYWCYSLWVGKGVLVTFFEDDITGAANDTST